MKTKTKYCIRFLIFLFANGLAVSLFPALAAEYRQPVIVMSGQRIFQDGDVISASQAGQPALYVAFNGTAETSDNMVINASGDKSHGVFARYGGQILLKTGTHIGVNGDQVYGIAAFNDSSLGGRRKPIITAQDDIHIRVEGTSAANGNAGIVAFWTGHVAIGDRLNIITYGDTGFGITAQYDGRSVGLGDLDPATIVVGRKATIATHGEQSWAISARGHALVETGAELQVFTAGRQSHGVFARGASEPGTRISLGEDSRISTLGEYSHGLFAQAELAGAQAPTIAAGDDLFIHTSGTMAHGIAAEGGIILTNDRTTITTLGELGHGLFAHDNDGTKSTLHIGANASVCTRGNDAYGIFSLVDTFTDAQVRITTGEKSSVTTQGDRSHAIVVSGGIVHIGDELQAQTQGTGAYGILVQASTPSPASAVFDRNAQIATWGRQAHSIWVQTDAGAHDAASFDAASGLRVNTFGQAAHGIVSTGGRVTLSDAAINISDRHSAYALYAEGTAQHNGRIEADGILDIAGDIVAGDHGHILLKLRETSNVSGAIRSTDHGRVELEMQSTHWQMTGDSTIDRLTAHDSLIVFADPKVGQHLSIETLAGSSTFVMKTNIAANQADRLILTGSSAGHHYVIMQNQGGIPVNGTETLDVITAMDAGSRFTLMHSVELGGWEYDLHARHSDNGSNWYLSSNRRPSSTTSIAANLAAMTPYLLTYAETQTLLQRLGDLHGDTRPSGAWARAYAGRFEGNQRNLIPGFDMDYSGFQLGVDRHLSFGDARSSTFYAGGLLGYAKGELDDAEPRRGSGKSESKTIGIYGVLLRPGDYHFDAVAKYAWVDNTFNTWDTQGQPIHGQNKTRTFSASLEAGRRVHLDRSTLHGFYWEPQVQLHYARQQGSRFIASNNLPITIDRFDSLQARIGLIAGYERQQQPLNLYFKVSGLREFHGDVTVKAHAASIQPCFRDTWIAYGVGLATRIGNAHHLYFDFERSQGGRFETPWSLNAGWRITF